MVVLVTKFGNYIKKINFVNLLKLFIFLIVTPVWAGDLPQCFSVVDPDGVCTTLRNEDKFVPPLYFITESDLLVTPQCSHSQLLTYPSAYCFPETINYASSAGRSTNSYQFTSFQVIDNQYRLNPQFASVNHAVINGLERNRQQSFNTAYRILTEFVEKYPDLKPQLESAAGYGVFETTTFNLLLYAGGWGDGMVFDKIEHKAIYVDTARVGTGLGLGYITEYTLIVFHSHFGIEQYFGANAGGDIGASATIAIWSKAVSFNPTISTYKIYRTGANIQGNWGGTVYWLSPLLN